MMPLEDSVKDMKLYYKRKQQKDKGEIFKFAFSYSYKDYEKT